jgi:hypothetical protein
LFIDERGREGWLDRGKKIRAASRQSGKKTSNKEEKGKAKQLKRERKEGRGKRRHSARSINQQKGSFPKKVFKQP